MQTTDNYDNMPATLAAKVQDYAQRTRRTAAAICRNAGLSQEDADTIAADAVDMLRADYRGLRATLEQMQRITAAVPRKRWDRTENAALCLVTKYYAQVCDTIAGGQLFLDFITSVAVLEVVQRDTSTPPLLVCDEDAVLLSARKLYYTYAVLICGEVCDATEDELRGIAVPAGVVVEDDKLARTIAAALRAQEQRKQLQQQARRKPGRPKKTEAQGNAGGLFGDEERTIYYFQNFAYEIGSGVQTADADEDKKPVKMRPLWQGIEEQRKRAEELAQDLRATDADRQKATALISTTTAAMQVLNGLQVLPQQIKPVSGNTEYNSYELTPHDYTRLLTGQEKPNKEQMLACLRATAWLSTQRVRIVERTETKRIERDSDGIAILGDDGKPKRKTVTRDIVTDFQPVVINFRSAYEDNVLIEDATRISVHIHKIFKDGRTAEYIEDGKKRLYIKKPQQKFLQLGQHYQFATEEERIFKNLVLSREHMTEDALLRAVFNYDKRQAEADARAAAAEATATATESNPDATEEQKTLAREAADNARRQAREYIYNHVSRDYNKLAGMFEKAQDCGLIKWYYRAPTAAPRRKAGQYGTGFKWEWGRGDDTEDTPRRGRGRPRKR